jgi:hypothetical protein
MKINVEGKINIRGIIVVLLQVEINGKEVFFSNSKLAKTDIQLVIILRYKWDAIFVKPTTHYIK